MSNKPFSSSVLLLIALIVSGCTGWGVPSVTGSKPYTYLNGGAQFGRDQLANRWLVAQFKIPIKGKERNEITTLLGEPQEVRITQHDISEDWYFSYYKNYKVPIVKADEGLFVVRFYHDEVIDVVKLA